MASSELFAVMRNIECTLYKEIYRYSKPINPHSGGQVVRVSAVDMVDCGIDSPVQSYLRFKNRKLSGSLAYALHLENIANTGWASDIIL